MSFTLFSVLLLLAVATAVAIEAVRGVKRGFMRALVGLSCVLISALVATWIAWILVPPLVSLLLEKLQWYEGIVRTYADKLPHIGEILRAAIKALIAPVLFLPIFLIVRLLLRALVALLFRTSWRGQRDDPSAIAAPKAADLPGGPNYARSKDSCFRRHDRIFGGITGGICGFLAALCLLSPIIGTLSTVNALYTGMDGMGVTWKKLGINEQQINAVAPYTNDAAVAVLGSFGGYMVYDMVAVSKVDWREITIRREAKTCIGIVEDLSRVFKIVAKGETVEEDQRDMIAGLGERVGASPVTSLLAADFLSSASTAWLGGERFLSVRRPSCGQIVDPMMDGVLSVCAQTNESFVGEDITTLLNIYLIASEYGLLNTNVDTDHLMHVMQDGGALDRLYAELKKNPRMAHLADELTNTALQVMSSTLLKNIQSSDSYRNMLSTLADAITGVISGHGLSFSEQVDQLTDYTLETVGKYNVGLPSGMAKMAVTAMLRELGGKETITDTDLDHFFSYYAGGLS